MSLVDMNELMEHLLAFYLGRRGIVWQAPSAQVANGNVHPIFQGIVGNAVLNTCIEFQQDVDERCTALWNYISSLPVPLDDGAIVSRIVRVYYDILENYGSQTQSTYVFMAVMFDLALQSARNLDYLLVQNLVLIIAIILHRSRLYDFQNFDRFVLYAFNHGQLPGN